MEKKMTAINQLLEWVKEFEDKPVKPTLTNVKEKIWQLLSIEREQIEDAYRNGWFNGGIEEAEQYYTQTYSEPIKDKI